MIVTIKNEYGTASINTIGAELSSLIIEGEEYIWQGEHWKGHAPVLFPICGRVATKVEYRGKDYDMPKHGFIKVRDFSVEEKSESAVTLLYSGTDEDYVIYPFKFTMRAIFKLDGKKLFVDFAIENLDEKDMPHQFGWHPAFVLFGEGSIENFTLDFGKDACPTQHLLTEDKFVSGAISSFPLEDGVYKISEEEIYTSDTIILSETNNYVTLSSPDTERVLKLEYTDNLPYIAIWKWPKSEARYLCLEPWCGIPGDGVSKEVLEKKVVRTLISGGKEVYSYIVKCK